MHCCKPTSSFWWICVCWVFEVLWWLWRCPSADYSAVRCFPRWRQAIKPNTEQLSQDSAGIVLFIDSGILYVCLVHEHEMIREIHRTCFNVSPQLLPQGSVQNDVFCSSCQSPPLCLPTVLCLCRVHLYIQSFILVQRIHGWLSQEGLYITDPQSRWQWHVVNRELDVHPSKVQVFEVISASVLAVTIPGAHQMGETGTRVMLSFPWIGHL